MNDARQLRLLRGTRILLIFFIIGLVLAGLSALPIPMGRRRGTGCLVCGGLGVWQGQIEGLAYSRLFEPTVNYGSESKRVAFL